MTSLRTWTRRLGACWIVVTTLYFFAHFAYIFYQANRSAIHRLLGG